MKSILVSVLWRLYLNPLKRIEGCCGIFPHAPAAALVFAHKQFETCSWCLRLSGEGAPANTGAEAHGRRSWWDNASGCGLIAEWKGGVLLQWPHPVPHPSELTSVVKTEAFKVCEGYGGHTVAQKCILPVLASMGGCDSELFTPRTTGLFHPSVWVIFAHMRKVLG